MTLSYQPSRPRKLHLPEVRSRFKELGYEAHLRYVRYEIGAAELEVKGPGMAAPLRFNASTVFSQRWARKHAKMLRLVREIRGAVVSRRFVV